MTRAKTPTRKKKTVIELSSLQTKVASEVEFLQGCIDADDLVPTMVANSLVEIEKSINRAFSAIADRMTPEEKAKYANAYVLLKIGM